MRLAFMGSPGFAVPALRALHAAGHEIAAVYCQPPRPAGRGHAVRRCAVHEAAESLGLAVLHPARLRGETAVAAGFAALDLEAAVVAAYGLILPAAMLAAPRRGCLNIHASLLPRWRGAAPIQAAILAGDTHSGVTIMRIDDGLDTGPMLLREAVPIDATTTARDLQDRLAAVGAALVARALAEWPAEVAQPEDGVTHAGKLRRSDAVIDWGAPAEEIERRIRALDPWPGTETRLEGRVLKVHAACVVEGGGAPGEVLDEVLTVACGRGALRLSRVQAEGRAAMAAGAFLRGRAVAPGTVLG